MPTPHPFPHHLRYPPMDKRPWLLPAVLGGTYLLGWVLFLYGAGLI